MGYEFDGDTKTVTLSTGTTDFDAIDLYSRWKDWVQNSDNAKWIMAMSTVGGEQVTDTETVGLYFFMENGWRIKPQETNHTLNVSGNLLVNGGGTPFINTDGNFNVRVLTQFSVNTVGIIGGSGVTPQSVWQYSNRTLTENNANIESIAGDSDAAESLSKSAASIVRANIVAGTLSTTQASTDLTETTSSHYNGRIIIFTSGHLRNQATDITGYNGTTKVLTFTALTSAPNAADSFIIV